MSLKRRNIIALVLILVAAVCWTFGEEMREGNYMDAMETSSGEWWDTTNPSPVYNTTFPATEYPDDSVPTTVYSTTGPAETQQSKEPHPSRFGRLNGFLLSFAAVAAGISGVLVLSQKNPILGPDGVCLALALLATAYHMTANFDYILWNYTLSAVRTAARIAGTATVLWSVRELLGWLRARLPLSWSLICRLANRCATPQRSLLTFVGWMVFALLGIVYFVPANAHSEGTLLGVLGYLAAASFGLTGIWKYGTDLNHFKEQLNNYQNGSPITVGDGAFAQTEAQLLQVQAQHEEAIRTAVTSERFKVELISNVSHDLRTPLTSILGYSELLQNEALSPEGQEQLRRLHQKAGYMNDLVESLFELTKVSSGVAESRKDQIDLVRLLEQTVGLFDDQLVGAGLTVKRSYCADTVPAVTDGARMHQVFANLLGNAIKYALAGTRIYLEVRETEGSYLIRMMNTASYEMDFKPEEIMQRFARGDKARSTKGSGLGLAIAQTYTESVGGSFRVSVDGDQFSAIVELPKN